MSPAKRTIGPNPPSLLVVSIWHRLTAAWSTVRHKALETRLSVGPERCPQLIHLFIVSQLPRYPVCVSHYLALLLCLSLPRPVLLDQLLRPRPNSFVLIFEGQDQRIDRSRGS